MRRGDRHEVDADPNRPRPQANDATTKQTATTRQPWKSRSSACMGDDPSTTRPSRSWVRCLVLEQTEIGDHAFDMRAYAPCRCSGVQDQPVVAPTGGIAPARSISSRPPAGSCRGPAPCGCRPGRCGCRRRWSPRRRPRSSPRWRSCGPRRAARLQGGVVARHLAAVPVDQQPAEGDHVLAFMRNRPMVLM